ncbi:shikimate dehydrogenase [Candidatus Gottesmanbacteria bacterium RIFCSPHIGHO2_02_FULL_40_13]|uniref:Shikimate dehydrogenase (NADP(+)) n=1 Tax=Candidatus Gottesmanbacteria bacterium RIFCSPHIGHO2_02_FULL_40_13 TaxID=1798384 RepID=A0A1F6A7W3_9BACT|nr:MAG: shikimate dehydrogenase [Candidatus Gottesmanbacteria bacterium RIFCSPHIGHO2_02_FULL_40_13]
MKINGETKIIGFFGSTYKTSKMFTLYNAAFKALQLNYVYVPFAVKDLKKAIEGIRQLGIKGVGVTIPYKIEAIKYLDELDENAQIIGAVNVIVNDNGKLSGGNTDGLGCVKALNEVTVIKNKNVLLLGAGGAARAIAIAVTDEGGNLIILNRNADLAKQITRKINARSNSIQSLAQEIEQAEILINATSVGMKPNENQSLVPKGLLRSDLTVMDLVTNPKETKLLVNAKEMQSKLVYGERMLFWQAVLKFKMFTGIDPPVRIMEQALKNINESIP